MQIIFAGAIKGAGDTWFVLLVTLLVSAIGVAVCWLGLDRGLFWWWFVVTGWICTLGIIFCVRFLRGRWREMRVIEREPPGADQESAATMCRQPVALTLPCWHNALRSYFAVSFARLVP